MITCPVCGIIKKETEYYFRDGRPRKSACKKCWLDKYAQSKEYRKTYYTNNYRNNREKHIKKALERYYKNKLKK